MQPLPLPPAPPAHADISRSIVEQSIEAMRQFAPLFTDLGYNLLGAFAIISISSFGIRTMLASAEGAGGLNLNELTRRLTLIGGIWIVIVYYNNPIPALGINAHQIVTDQSHSLASTLRTDSVQRLLELVNNLLGKTHYPGNPFDIGQFLTYYFFLLLFGAAELAVLVILGFGYLAQAVCVLLGPIFIPFLLFSHLDWLFWGWLKAFVQFAFYQVIAEAYLYVMINVLLTFKPRFDSYSSMTATSADAAAILIIFTVFIFSVFKLPALVATIFTGGGTGWGAFGQGAGSFVRQVAVRRLF